MTKKNGKNYYDAIIKSFMKSWQRKVTGTPAKLSIKSDCTSNWIFTESYHKMYGTVAIYP